MSFNFSPKISLKGLVFYIDPFNFKSRNRSLPLTGDTIIDLTSSYYFAGDLVNMTFPSPFTGTTPDISSNFKYINFDGTDDNILFPSNTLNDTPLKQPFVRYKPETYTLSAWVKSGTTSTGTGGAGVMFWGGGNDWWLQTPALTATTNYPEGTYTGVIGENWSATTVAQAALNLPSFEITVDSGGTITKAIAESFTLIGGGPAPESEEVIVRISGNTIGGSTPADDAYFLWLKGTSSLMRWGLQIRDGYSMITSNSIDKEVFTTDRVSNEPKEWNLITITDTGQLAPDNLSCYVNGELVNTGTGTFLNGSQMNPGTINTGQLNIGRGSSSTFNTYLIGSLGPCMAYDRALTPNEVLRNYNALKSRFDIL